MVALCRLIRLINLARVDYSAMGNGSPQYRKKQFRVQTIACTLQLLPAGGSSGSIQKYTDDRPAAAGRGGMYAVKAQSVLGNMISTVYSYPPRRSLNTKVNDDEVKGQKPKEMQARRISDRKSHSFISLFLF
ncbi:hypothetical protein VOLCADRAFT_98853 [Volvox carteri f. nagariensis]|uniref:Uncharacterized protein n=1 Tax=Volvox carteri f. nagariensis TaxID=3068 RepID=D8UGG1_VOLCA|nr:uncharacterized protein VOLCADRAFT_98853 [Volvox carteri f. nagariensis]EFJ41170.1 hypothetical protein VOLCADRAFT_98853 [Volvox carteri f. nagariensis]|eukprot:XP_002957738.1 hypothetical protein VOLCADRAFT_98853 [Volvox carteri f. nagariensis]